MIKVLGETKYFIYKPNNIKIGIGEAKNPAKVHKNQEVYLLENYSNIKTQLLAEKGLFAPFYIYIHIDKFSDSLENLRKSIGEAIAEEINNYFKDNSN